MNLQYIAQLAGSVQSLNVFKIQILKIQISNELIKRFSPMHNAGQQVYCMWAGENFRLPEHRRRHFSVILQCKVNQNEHKRDFI